MDTGRNGSFYIMLGDKLNASKQTDWGWGSYSM